MEGIKGCHKERRNKSHNFTERLYLISILLKFLEDKTTFPYYSIDEMSRMHFVLKINKQCILITFNCQYAMEMFLPHMLAKAKFQTYVIYYCNHDCNLPLFGLFLKPCLMYCWLKGELCHPLPQTLRLFLKLST